MTTHTDGWRRDVEQILNEQGVKWTAATIDDFVSEIIAKVFGNFCRDFKERAEIMKIADELRRGVNHIILQSGPKTIAHLFRHIQSSHDEDA